ncbi:GntR family transcriptional regulator [Octadecabacter sp.]|nr:GntR family transcriptional regulator [Octadecabacter sp.]
MADGQADALTLTQKAYHALEEQIVTLTLRPGTVLSEAGLAKSLSIGRTPVREALQRLAAEGLVTVLPRRGILVSDINPGQQIQLLTVRRELERLIAKEAARRRAPDQAQAFAHLATGFAEAAHSKDDVTFMRLDSGFNKMLLEACDNPFAANAMRAMQGLSRRFWYNHYKQFLDLKRCAMLHENVARAVADGAEIAAAQASDRLIDYIEEFSRATV